MTPEMTWRNVIQPIVLAEELLQNSNASISKNPVATTAFRLPKNLAIIDPLIEYAGAPLTPLTSDA